MFSSGLRQMKPETKFSSRYEMRVYSNVLFLGNRIEFIAVYHGKNYT